MWLLKTPAEATSGSTYRLFIPPTYLSFPQPGFIIRHAPDEEQRHLSFLAETTGTLLAFFRTAFDFNPSRQLFLCCYNDNVTARAQLGREIDTGMALAPFSGEELSLIVLQSPQADIRNGDPLRMRHIIAHEICHCLMAEFSGSTKILGDGNRNMKVAAWYDEGLAETAAFIATDRTECLSVMVRNYEHLPRMMTALELNHAFEQLDGEERAPAFLQATVLVYREVLKSGLRGVFRDAAAYPRP